MNDTFPISYDLQLAGFDFEAVKKKSDHNIALLNGIAEDIVKASDHKAGIKCAKEEILYRFYEAVPSIAMVVPLMVLYIASSSTISLKFINRSSPSFHNFFY
jgi:hypothetical protein